MPSIWNVPPTVRVPFVGGPSGFASLAARNAKTAVALLGSGGFTNFTFSAVV